MLNDINKIAVVASDPAAAAEQRLEMLVKRGKARAGRVLQLLEKLMPKDYLVRPVSMSFRENIESRRLEAGFFVKTEEQQLFREVHSFALSQMATTVEMPGSWAQKLHDKVSPDGKDRYGLDILARDLETLFAYVPGHFMLRIVENEIRGFLSDRYKRLDSKPLVESFCEACARVGAVPCDGFASDTRITIQAVLPKIQEPVEGEKVVYGVSFENSDFGNGAMNVKVFMLRLASGTGMICTTGLRKVHLGERLVEDVTWSDKTKTADIMLVQAQIDDLVVQHLSQERIDEAQMVIRKAYGSKLGDNDVLTAVLKKFLTKGEIEELIKKYNTPDVVELPPGNNVWRLVNAVSWLADTQKDKDEDRAMELQRVSGRLLTELST